MIDRQYSSLLRELGYGAVYPQTLPHHRREDATVQAAHVAWACEKARHWLTVLDRDLLGAKPYLCGDEFTLADDVGISVVTLGEVIRMDFSPWIDLWRWIATMKARPHWGKVNDAFYTYYVAPYRGVEFVRPQARKAGRRGRSCAPA